MYGLIFWVPDIRQLNQTPPEKIEVWNGREHIFYTQFISLPSNPTHWERMIQHFFKTFTKARPTEAKQKWTNLFQCAFPPSANLANALGRLPVQWSWEIPS